MFYGLCLEAWSRHFDMSLYGDLEASRDVHDLGSA